MTVPFGQSSIFNYLLFICNCPTENLSPEVMYTKYLIIFYSSYSALAAASSPLGVIGGALAGHGVATLVTPYFHQNNLVAWLNDKLPLY